MLWNKNPIFHSPCILHPPPLLQELKVVRQFSPWPLAWLGHQEIQREWLQEGGTLKDITYSAMIKANPQGRESCYQQLYHQIIPQNKCIGYILLCLTFWFSELNSTTFQMILVLTQLLDFSLIAKERFGCLLPRKLTSASRHICPRKNILQVEETIF